MGKLGTRDINVQEGRGRVIIEGVKPEIDGGRFPVKRTPGEKVVVEADMFADGHDVIWCVLLFRKEDESKWTEIPMEHLGNDRWRGHFEVRELGRYLYTLRAWVDPFKSWRSGLEKKLEADQDISMDLLMGAEIIEATSQRASKADAKRLGEWASILRSKKGSSEKQRIAVSENLATLVEKYHRYSKVQLPEIFGRANIIMRMHPGTEQTCLKTIPRVFIQ